jgi:hypothetical protein
VSWAVLASRIASIWPLAGFGVEVRDPDTRVRSACCVLGVDTQPRNAGKPTASVIFTLTREVLTTANLDRARHHR